jgi:hypothetical protein
VARQAAVASAIRGWHKDKKDTNLRLSAMAHTIERGLDNFDLAMELARKEPRSPHIKSLLDEVRGLPAYGLSEHEWHGYASVILAEEPRKDGGGVLYDICNSTHLGRQFIDCAIGWPPIAKRLHVEGKLGAAGAWDKLLPPSFSGLMANIVGACLHVAFKMMSGLYSSSYAILQLRASVTSEFVTQFFFRHPELFLR